MSKSKRKNTRQAHAGNGAKQFLIGHGEKFVVALIAIFALWLAMQGLGYQTLSWQPSELEQIASDTEQAIMSSTRTVDSEDLKIFDYAGHAEQIKKPIPATPYRIPLGTEWEPVLGASPTPQKTGVQQDSDESLSGSEESPESESSQTEVQ